MSYAFARITFELIVASKIIRRALDLGYLVSVSDGEETVIKNSTDFQALVNALASTDADRLTFRTTPIPGRRNTVGWVELVYGNDGVDVIHDYSDNAATKDVLSVAEKMIETVENQCAFGKPERASNWDVLQAIKSDV